MYIYPHTYNVSDVYIFFLFFSISCGVGWGGVIFSWSFNKLSPRIEKYSVIFYCPLLFTEVYLIKIHLNNSSIIIFILLSLSICTLFRQSLMVCSSVKLFYIIIKFVILSLYLCIFLLPTKDLLSHSYTKGIVLY